MEKETRREFLEKIFVRIAGLSAVVLTLWNIAKYIYPRISPPKLRKILVAKEGEIAPGEAKEINFGGELLFLVNLGKEYKAFSATCTHLGCKVRWEGHKQRFFCPCHKAIFSSDGKVVSGPPPRPLDEFKVEVDRDFVYMWIEEKQSGKII